jgi:hypothetical protein
MAVNDIDQTKTFTMLSGRSNLPDGPFNLSLYTILYNGNCYYPEPGCSKK